MTSYADPEVIQKSKQTLGQMEAILGNEETIISLVNDILDHYENYRLLRLVSCHRYQYNLRKLHGCFDLLEKSECL